MDPFNIGSGVVSLLSLAFAVYVELAARHKGKLERERVNGQQSRLQALVQCIVAAQQQAALMTVVVDRPETTMKEMKHLTLAAVATIGAARAIAADELEATKRWKWGVPSEYLRTMASGAATKSE